MTNPVLDDNLRRLLQRSSPRLSEEDLDRAFARFEGRRRPAAAQSRRLAAVAAALVLGLLGWLALSSPPRQAAPGTQDSAEEIARLIADLGSPQADVREKAKSRLLALGPAALGPLDRALYHEVPEVRLQSQALAKIVRRRAEIQGSLAFVHAAVAIVRTHWIARDFTDFKKAVQSAFEPEEPPYIHYVPRKSLRDSFDVLLGPDRVTYFKGLQGAQDALTSEMQASLDKEEGILLLDKLGGPTDLGEFCVFTLPDKIGWSAYVIVSLSEDLRTGEPLQRWACAMDEPGRFFQSSSLTPQPGGGLKVGELDPNANSMAKAFKKGDVLRALNGTPLRSVADALPLVERPAHEMIVTLERDGKVFPILFNVLQRVILKRPAKPIEEEAQLIFEQAEQLSAFDPERAILLYTKLLKNYDQTEFVSKAKRPWIEERIASLKEKKK